MKFTQFCESQKYFMLSLNVIELMILTTLTLLHYGMTKE